MRWGLLMKYSPALHILNVGDVRNDEHCREQFGPTDMFNKYAKFGMNVVCMQNGLKLSCRWAKKVWGQVGDGFHNTTRYGELPNVSMDRKKSLGVVFRNWHPGPLGFQVVSDGFGY